ncbi:NAD(P)/FAD-dependent oxidoreductase [Brachybacterium sp. AOP43-C2-M15]|uniref:NAD(P)/FAD-dependent oxidoreductase n=1 Tax=Brachybacterium sp. AOP43-C2-M15 TaxID=3457661 RepID=UPI0040349EFB
MSDLEHSYDHVIIGGGVAADSAARAIRELDPEATIAIISADAHGPVHRPALSKELWHGEDPDPSSQDLHTAEETGAHLITATLVTELRPASHSLVTAGGQWAHYGRALLATGASPRRLREVHDPRVAYLRTVGDYRHLRELATEGAHLAVVGGGCLGPEIAAGLSRTGAQVSLAHAGRRILDHLLPASISEHLEQVYAEHGITLVPGYRLTGIDTGSDTQLTLHSESGEQLRADVTVLALGAELNTTLAARVGIELEHDAVVVDPRLRTSATDVYAAGDIAWFDDALLGPRHVEHVDNAQATGAAAGRNMAGAEEDLEHSPLLYSDLFDDGYEAVGRLDTALEVREEWNPERTAAVVHYLEDGVLEGVLLWNTWDAADRARALIAASQEGELSADDLARRITPGG